MIVDEACVCIADHSQATSTTPFQFLYKHGMLTHSYTNAMIQTHDLCVKTCHYLLTYAPWVSRCFFHICQYPNWEPDKHSSLYKPQHINILTGSVSLIIIVILPGCSPMFDWKTLFHAGRPYYCVTSYYMLMCYCQSNKLAFIFSTWSLSVCVHCDRQSVLGKIQDYNVLASRRCVVCVDITQFLYIVSSSEAHSVISRYWGIVIWWKARFP